MFLPAEVMEKYVSNNRMGIFTAMMAANMVSGSILTTNAFEISHNGEMVWSAMSAAACRTSRSLSTSSKGAS